MQQELTPELQDLLALWRRKYGTRPIPSIGRLTAPELEPWLPHLAMIDVEAKGGFYIRAFGPALIRRFGREATDNRVDELAPDIAGGLNDALWRAMALAAPVIARPKVQLGRRTAEFSELILPLACHSGRVTRVLLAGYEL